MARYSHGVAPLAPGLFAYLQPDGAWGLSNAGLIVSEGESLLVDTLYDLARTRRMLDDFARAEPAARRIGRVVNTHANGDHCWGNAALPGAEIIASRRSAEEMAELPPARLALLVRAARLATRLGPRARALLGEAGRVGLGQVAAVGRAAPFVLHAFGAYDFEDIALAPPTRTFDGELSVQVGAREVRLLEVGPAHTRGDVLAHVPDARAVFTGDLLFTDAHPIVWAGPFSSWIRALDRIEALAPEHVVPGHGRLATLDDVRATRAYLRHVYDEAKRRHEAGMSAHDAARDIALGAFSHWTEAERIVVNVAMVYRELDGLEAPASPVELFAAMGEYWEERRLTSPGT